MGSLVVGGLWLLVLAVLLRRAPRQPRARVLAGDVLAGGLLFLLTMGFFWRTLSGDVFQPADGGDLVSFLFPTYRFAAEQIRHGLLPLWNPHLYGGAPFISDIQAGFLYPPNFLLFLLKPDFDYAALQWMSIGHLYWAGLGMYVLLRGLKVGAEPLSRPAALLGAVAFQYSDALLIHLGNLNLIAVLSWLPWVLAAFLMALDTRSSRWIAVTALLFSVANYAGHAQSSYYIGLALSVYALAVVAVSWSAVWQDDTRDPLAWRTILPLLQPLGYVALVALVTLLLTAPLLLPALELTGYTARGDFTYQDTIAYSLAPTQALAGVITPGFFGRGPALHWSLWDRVETPYVGVVTVVLALGALLLTPRLERRRLWPWCGVALFGLLTALGVYAVWHGWMTLILPGFGTFRAPARAIVLWSLAVSVLGAWGLDQVTRILGAATAQQAVLYHAERKQGGRSFRAVLAGGGLILLGVITPLAYLGLLLTQADGTAFLRASLAALALVFAALFWMTAWLLIIGYRDGWYGPAILGIALVALLFFDLSATGAYTDISSADPTIGFQQQAIVDFLRADPDRFRIDTRTDIADLWQPDAAALHALDDVWGVANPLVLRHWRATWEATGGRQTRLYDMLNVKYVLVRDGTPLPDGKFEPAFDAPGDLAVFRNVDAMPRAWLVNQVDLVPPGTFDAANLSALFQEYGLDPDRTALVEAGAVQAAEIGAALASGRSTDAGRSTAAGTVVEDRAGDRAGEVVPTGSARRLLVDAPEPAFLVLSEVWYPGWRAIINGDAAPVLRVNGGLQGLLVPAGRSTVQLTFAPTSWRVGLWAFAAGLPCLLVLFMFPRTGWRKGQPPAVVSGTAVPGPTR